MKRRSFLQKGILGTVCLGNPIASTLMANNSAEDIRTWFRTVCDAFSARCRTQIPASLQQLADQSEAYLNNMGYDRDRKGIYFCADGQTGFFPMLLRKARSGMTELAVPVFIRQADNTWKQVLVLNGYQIEALCLASQKIVDEKTPIAELLVPAGIQPVDGFRWNTRSGSVTMMTVLKSGEVQTDMNVYSGNRIVFSERIFSKHTLTSTPSPNT